jgi:hypothetical protein
LDRLGHSASPGLPALVPGGAWPAGNMESERGTLPSESPRH